MSPLFTSNALVLLAGLKVAYASPDESFEHVERPEQLDVIPRPKEVPRPKEEDAKVWFPPTPVRALSEAPGRSLARGPRGECIRSVLQIAVPDTLNKWGKCVQSKVNSTDLTVAGSNFAITFGCWCEEKVQQVLEQFGCCSHQDYKLLCQAQCSPDCTTPNAKRCIKDCPAHCLENDYQPEFCNPACNNCSWDVKCTTDHAKQMTQAGSPSYGRVCDDRGFDNSTEWKKWKECFTGHPMRTHWHRHNSENHCYCEADLKSAAERNKCCTSSWGKTICDEQCADAKSSIDCSSAEAQKCMSDCKQICHKLYVETVSPQCNSTCFQKSAKCSKYSVCKPVGPFEFDYICDDGTKPQKNGCCIYRNSYSCPSLCDYGAPHYPVHNAVGLRFQHGLECQCLGCPANTTGAKSKFKLKVLDDLWKNGVATLAVISKEVGILGANKKMQLLMKERNDKIVAEYEAHPGMPDATFQKKVDQIVKEYYDKIKAEAVRYEKFGDPTPAPPPSPPPPSKDDDDDDDDKKGGKKGDDDDGNTTIIIAAVCGVVGLLLLFGIVFMVYKIKTKSPANVNSGANATVAEPMEGDGNVVVGRPVDPANDVGAAAGAPVATGNGEKSEKGQDKV